MILKLKVDCPKCGKEINMGNLEIKNGDSFDLEYIEGMEVECDCGTYKYAELYWRDC